MPDSPKKLTKKQQKAADAEKATNDIVDDEREISEGEVTAHKVNTLYEQGREETIVARLNYWLNRAFWQGHQWTYIPKGYTFDAEIDIVPGSEKKRRERATENRIQPAMNNSIARAMKTSITLEVMSQTADDFAQQGAQVGEGILRSKGLDEDWEQIKERLITAAYLGGTSALVTEWDAKAHRFDDDVTTGDAVLSALSIEDFVIEPGSIDARTARWWIRKQVLPAAAVQATYELKEKPKEDASSGGPYSADSIKANSSLGAKKGTQVLTYFERPNHLRPEGAVVIVVGNDVVWEADSWPFPFEDHLNLDVLTCIQDPESWLGESPVTQAISPQRQLNQLASKIHETIHRTAGSKLIIDARHAEMNKKIDDDPETMIELAAAADAKDPYYLEPPKLAPYVTNMYEMLSTQIDDALGVHSISRGEAGVNAPDSGYGLSILAENDASQVGRLLKEVARVFASAGTNILKLYSEKVKDTRETVVATDYGTHVEKWSGKSLAGQTRAIVPPDSVLPRSEAGILKMSMDLLQYKGEWFQTFDQWANIATVPGIKDMKSAMADDLATAEWENGRMAQGEAVEVYDCDDHAKHIQQHNHFRKSPRYRLMEKKKQAIFDLHIQAHRSAAMEDEGKKLAQQQLMANLGRPPADPNDPNADPGTTPTALPGAELPESGSEPFVPEVPQGEMN